MSPKFLIGLTAACIAFAPGAMAQSQTGPGASGTPDASRAGGAAAGAIIGGAAGAKSGAPTGQTGAPTERMGGGAGKSKDTGRMGGGAGVAK